MGDGVLPTPSAPQRFGRHPKYRDSGVEWLGEIPAHWEVAALQYRYEQTLGKMLDTKRITGDHLVPYLRNVDVQWDHINISDLPSMDIRPHELERFTVRRGDLLVCEGGEAGRCAIWQGKLDLCGYQKALHRLRPFDRGRDAPRFLYYTLSTAVARGAFAGGQGSTIAHLTGDMLRVHRFPFPPGNEQHSIARFLDRETEKIETLLAKQRELISLLQEQRAALISHVVTKGLAPSVTMKDSSVEWLGEIPAHWEVKRTKFVAALRSGHTPSRQKPEYWKRCTIPWFGLADIWQVRDGQVEYVQETAEKISEIGLANSSARLLPEGTVILSRTASVGFSAILGVDMATTQDFVNWICGPSLRPEYLLYAFRAMGPEFRRLTMGSTHQTIYMHDVASFSTPVPPVSEQDQIVAFVRKETAKIDAMIAKVNEAIDRLSEYRTTFISAAVTGQIDVRSHLQSETSVKTVTPQPNP